MTAMTAEAYAGILRRELTNRVKDETALQDAVAALLPGLRREWSFDASNRIDFFDEPNRIGIECKVKPGAAAIERQLARYEPHCPGGLVLVTTRAVTIRDFLQVPFSIATLGFW